MPVAVNDELFDLAPVGLGAGRERYPAMLADVRRALVAAGADQTVLRVEVRLDRHRAMTILACADDDERAFADAKSKMPEAVTRFNDLGQPCADAAQLFQDLLLAWCRRTIGFMHDPYESPSGSWTLGGNRDECNGLTDLTDVYEYVYEYVYVNGGLRPLTFHVHVLVHVLVHVFSRRSPAVLTLALSIPPIYMSLI